jgi:hypothetical protein
MFVAGARQLKQAIGCLYEFVRHRRLKVGCATTRADPGFKAGDIDSDALSLELFRDRFPAYLPAAIRARFFPGSWHPAWRLALGFILALAWLSVLHYVFE